MGHRDLNVIRQLIADYLVSQGETDGNITLNIVLDFKDEGESIKLIMKSQISGTTKVPPVQEIQMAFLILARDVVTKMGDDVLNKIGETLILGAVGDIHVPGATLPRDKDPR